MCIYEYFSKALGVERCRNTTAVAPQSREQLLKLQAPTAAVWGVSEWNFTNDSLKSYSCLKNEAGKFAKICFQLLGFWLVGFFFLFSFNSSRGISVHCLSCSFCNPAFPLLY